MTVPNTTVLIEINIFTAHDGYHCLYYHACALSEMGQDAVAWLLFYDIFQKMS